MVNATDMFKATQTMGNQLEPQLPNWALSLPGGGGEEGGRAEFVCAD